MTKIADCQKHGDEMAKAETKTTGPWVTPGGHYAYEPGDRVKDLTFDPPLFGRIVRPHHKPDAYYVHIDGATNDVIIHARNLLVVEEQPK